MAETREVVVTIKSHSLGGSQPPAGSPGSTQAAQGPQSPEISESNNVATEARDSQTALTTIAVQLGEKVLQQAVQVALGEADYWMVRSFYLKDDYIGQRNYSIAKAHVSNAVGFAAFAGTSMATMGPVAGAIAIAAKVVVDVAKSAVEYNKARVEQNAIVRQLDANLQFNRTRAGYSLTAGSIGENR